MTWKRMIFRNIENQMQMNLRKLNTKQKRYHISHNIIEMEKIPKEQIRKEWSKYKDEVDVKSQFYEDIWDDWCKKYKEDKNEIYVKILKSFIDDTAIPKVNGILDHRVTIIKEEDTLNIRHASSYDRAIMHQLCDLIGLHHETKQYGGKNNKKKKLCVEIPDNWSWEFTNDLHLIERERIERKLNPRIEKMKRMYCRECEKNGLETELFHSAYIRGIYCQNCLDIESDGDGGVLSDHKFEPYIYY